MASLTTNLPSCDAADVDALASSSSLTQATLPDMAAACRGVAPDTPSSAHHTAYSDSHPKCHTDGPGGSTQHPPPEGTSELT